MNKKIIAASIAVIAAGGLGFGYYWRNRTAELDLTKSYGAYLDYAFDGDYSLDLEKDGELNDWTLTCTYTDGKPRSFSIGVPPRYKVNDESIIKDTAQQYTLEFVESAALDRLKKEFSENILSKYIDGEYDMYNFTGSGVTVRFLPLNCGLSEHGLTKYTDAMMDPKTGFKCAGIDLNSFLNDSSVGLCIVMEIDRAADEEKYSEIFRKVAEELRNYTDSPQNYGIRLVRKYEEDEKDKYEYLLKEEYWRGEKVSVSNFRTSPLNRAVEDRYGIFSDEYAAYAADKEYDMGDSEVTNALYNHVEEFDWAKSEYSDDEIVGYNVE